jgi:hypothetical protein
VTSTFEKVDVTFSVLLIDGAYKLSIDPSKVTANGVAMAAAPAPSTGCSGTPTAAAA